MRTTIILLTLGLGIQLPSVAQELSFDGLEPSPIGTNVIQNHTVTPAEIPTLNIKPTDVVLESIESIEFTSDTAQEILSQYTTIKLPNYNTNALTNAFRVSWRYTTEAAKQVLAFRGRHGGQKVRTVVGSISRTQPVMPIWSARLSEPGWLAKPVDSISGLTEAQAKQMVAALKGK